VVGGCSGQAQPISACSCCSGSAGPTAAATSSGAGYSTKQVDQGLLRALARSAACYKVGMLRTWSAKTGVVMCGAVYLIGSRHTTVRLGKRVRGCRVSTLVPVVKPRYFNTSTPCDYKVSTPARTREGERACSVEVQPRAWAGQINQGRRVGKGSFITAVASTEGGAGVGVRVGWGHTRP
jgi:hypothetical protein